MPLLTTSAGRLTSRVLTAPAVLPDWEPLADLPLGLEQHGFEALNGKLYVTGGVNGSVERAETYVYDIATNTWDQLDDVPHATQSHVLRAANGKLYHISGHDSNLGLVYDEVYELDPNTGAWTEKTPIPTGREDMGSARLPPSRTTPRSSSATTCQRTPGKRSAARPMPLAALA